MTQTDGSRATGTFGGPRIANPLSPDEVNERFGNRSNPVDYSAPPEAKR
jgi:hypothetical protein